MAQVPKAWATLQEAWAKATAEDKKAQGEYWRKQLLLPGQLLVGLSPGLKTYRFKNDKRAAWDTVVF